MNLVHGRKMEDNDPVDLEVRHFRLIQAIAQEGAMTRAAQRLHLTQSALSHQLTGLEAGLGMPLFQRIPRGMRLTAAGERLRASGQTVLREIADAQQQIRSLANDESGTLRLSTECYTCYHWLPAKIRNFQAKHPRVDLRIVVEATRHPLEALGAGQLDVAIVTGYPSRAGFRVHPLFDDELVAILSPEHPLASRAYLRAQDFASEHLITYSVPLSQLTVFTELLTPAGIAPARVSQVELTEAVVEMVKANLGIAVLARWAVAPHLGASLKALPLTRKGYSRSWTAVTRAARRQPRYLGNFLEILSATKSPFR